MEEIALVFSSLAGACTAVALDKIPKRKTRNTSTVSSAMENQLHTLNIEKEILAKTITRLYNDESGTPKVQRERLLSRYQHQLGAISAKIEKVEAASRYPDLGPVGDSIITLMDSRLSKLDQKLHEISSKITVSNPQQSPQSPQPSAQPQEVQQARQESPRQIVQERPPERASPKVDARREVEVIVKEKVPEVPTINLHVPDRHVSVELSTLTTIPSKMPEFPAEFIKPPVTAEAPKVDAPKVEESKKLEELQPMVPVEPAPIVKTEEKPRAEAPKPEPIERIQMPAPIRIPDEEKIEDDDKDLDKIKSEIMRALSKLEQVEVE